MQKKHLFLIILGVLIILLTLITFLINRKQELSTPPPKQPTPIPTQPVVIMPNPQLNYQLNNISYPNPPSMPYTTLDIIQVEHETLKNIASTIINQYNLSPLSSVPTYFLSSDQTVSLSINGDENQLLFSTVNPSQNIGIDITSAQTELKSQLQSQNIQNMYVDTGSAMYLDSSPEPQEIAASQASAVKIPMYHFVNNFPLVYENQSIFEQFGIINADNQLIKLQFNPPIKSFVPIASKQTITISEALEQIANNNAIITHVSSADYEYTANISNFNSVIIDNMQVEYRLDSKTGIASPYFHFFGIGKSAGQNYNVHIITNAIKTP